MVQLVGEPGIGKSRLLAELARQAGERGHLVLEGRAAEFERDVPFGLVVDALNDYAGALPRATLDALGEETVAELAALLPSLAALLPTPSPRRLEAERFRAHYAIRALLERLAEDQPVVLALDDLHWADDESVEVIGHLIRRFRGPFLAALAFRHPPDRLAAVLDAAGREGLATRLLLGPLSAEDADALLDPRLDPDARAALRRESGGNPFYLEALQHASPRTEPELVPSAAPRAGPVAGPYEPPPSVAAAIHEELAGLPEDSRRVLDSAAVAGESFDPALVAAIAEVREPVALAAVDRLLAADLVRPTEAPRRFRFRHPIVRRAVYDAMPGGWRLGAHARAAAALAAAGAPLAARAHHVERCAAPGDETAVTTLTAAARAVAPRAPLTAGRWLSSARGVAPADADPERRLMLLIEAAAALGEGGAFDRALTALEEALPLVPAERADVRADVVDRRATAKRLTGHPLLSRALLQEALDGLEDQDGDPALTLRIEIAISHYFAGEFGDLHAAAGTLLGLGRARADALLTALSA